MRCNWACNKAAAGARLSYPACHHGLHPKDNRTGGRREPNNRSRRNTEQYFSRISPHTTRARERNKETKDATAWSRPNERRQREKKNSRLCWGTEKHWRQAQDKSKTNPCAEIIPSAQKKKRPHEKPADRSPWSHARAPRRRCTKNKNKKTDKKTRNEKGPTVPTMFSPMHPWRYPPLPPHHPPGLPGQYLAPTPSAPSPWCCCGATGRTAGTSWSPSFRPQTRR